MRGAIAAGNLHTAEAGAWALSEGGSAVDAVVAAALAAFVAEGPLTGPAGAGFLLVSRPGHEPELVDCFFSVPSRPPAAMDEVVIDFADASTQVFHIGASSVAVPGIVHGLAEAHARHGVLPWRVLATPALDLAHRGVVPSEAQRFLHEILVPILQREEGGKRVYGRPRTSSTAATSSRRSSGFVTSASTRSPSCSPSSPTISRGYEARITTPLECGSFRDARIVTTPAPSRGGTVVTRALEHPRDRRARRVVGQPGRGGAARRRARRWLRRAQRALGPPGRHTCRSSTADGQAAGLSSTLGSGSGVFRHGFQLNNMLGELDVIGTAERAGRRAAAEHDGADARARRRAPRLVVGSAGSVRLAGAIVAGVDGRRRARARRVPRRSSGRVSTSRTGSRTSRAAGATRRQRALPRRGWRSFAGAGGTCSSVVRPRSRRVPMARSRLRVTHAVVAPGYWCDRPSGVSASLQPPRPSSALRGAAPRRAACGRRARDADRRRPGRRRSPPTARTSATRRLMLGVEQRCSQVRTVARCDSSRGDRGPIDVPTQARQLAECVTLGEPQLGEQACGRRADPTDPCVVVEIDEPAVPRRAGDRVEDGPDSTPLGCLATCETDASVAGARWEMLGVRLELPVLGQIDEPVAPDVEQPRDATPGVEHRSSAGVGACEDGRDHEIRPRERWSKRSPGTVSHLQTVPGEPSRLGAGFCADFVRVSTRQRPRRQPSTTSRCAVVCGDGMNESRTRRRSSDRRAIGSPPSTPCRTSQQPTTVPVRPIPPQQWT